MNARAAKAIRREAARLRETGKRDVTANEYRKAKRLWTRAPWNERSISDLDKRTASHEANG